MGEEKEKRTFSEEIEVAGNELVDRVKELMQESNVRRLIIRNQEGEVLVEIPLTAALLGGGVAVLVAPLLAAVGGIAAFLAKVKIEVVREDEGEGETPPSRLEKPDEE